MTINIPFTTMTYLADLDFKHKKAVQNFRTASTTQVGHI